MELPPGLVPVKRRWGRKLEAPFEDPSFRPPPGLEPVMDQEMAQLWRHYRCDGDLDTVTPPEDDTTRSSDWEVAEPDPEVESTDPSEEGDPVPEPILESQVLEDHIEDRLELLKSEDEEEVVQESETEDEREHVAKSREQRHEPKKRKKKGQAKKAVRKPGKPRKLKDDGASSKWGRVPVLLCVFLVLAAAAAWMRVPQSPTAKRKPMKQEKHCAMKVPRNVMELNSWETIPAPSGVTPRISLHASCLWNSFERASQKWAPSGTWYWKKLRVGEPEHVEVQHRHEAPMSVLNISSCKDCHNQMHRALANAMFPLFGELTEETYQWYSVQYGAGLVVLMPDPDQHSSLTKAQDYWRATFEALALEFQPRYRMVYASTMDDTKREWLRRSFGVADFPAVVIRPPNGLDHVYKGEITQQSIALQIQDVNTGCFSWEHPLRNFNRPVQKWTSARW